MKKQPAKVIENVQLTAEQIAPLLEKIIAKNKKALLELAKY